MDNDDKQLMHSIMKEGPSIEQRWKAEAGSRRLAIWGFALAVLALLISGASLIVAILK